MFKKIDIFFNGKYLCSTNQSKTCKQAKENYLARLSVSKNLNDPHKQILLHPEKLKAFFDK